VSLAAKVHNLTSIHINNQKINRPAKEHKANSISDIEMSSEAQRKDGSSKESFNSKFKEKKGNNGYQ